MTIMKSFAILLVENNRSYGYLAREVVAFLQRGGKYAGVTRPAWRQAAESKAK